MNAVTFALWTAIAIVTVLLLSMVQRPLRRNMSIPIILIIDILKLLGSAVILLCSITLKSYVIWNLHYTPVILGSVLMCDALADLIALTVHGLIRKGSFAVIAEVLSVLMSFSYIIYGTVNMQNITARETVFVSDKLQKEHTFVFLSDLHYLAVQTEETVDQAFREIAERKPEFVVLGGDITDEHTSAEEMKAVYEKLGKLGVPVYFVYGNHDRQPNSDFLGGEKYSAEELEETIRANGLTILKEDSAVISEDLVLFGREDITMKQQRLPADKLPSLLENRYAVCIDHSPKAAEENASAGFDLQLSGHTHAGQFFPMQYIYRLHFKNVSGRDKVGTMDICVTPGISGWYYPFRTAEHCTYEVITLRPEKL